MKELVLGGARSGKSRYAESQALGLYSGDGISDKSLYYVATACAGDEEMKARIDRHRALRSEDWHVVEEPVQLARALLSLNQNGNIVVVDCLTLYLSNLLALEDEDLLRLEKQALTKAISDLRCDIFIVSNEVGSGIVPLGKLTRNFVDHSGWLHQSLAQICDKVTLVVAGLPLVLKS